MLRSMLFVPGDRPERFEKALSSGADAVIQDLEDSVAPQDKERARLAVAQSITPNDPGRARRFVRINGLDTSHSWDDIQAVVRPGLEAIVLPKTQSAHDVHIISYLLGQLELRRGMSSGSIAIVPLVETAIGTQQLTAISAASPRVKHLTFGAVDLSLELSLDMNNEAQNLSQLRWQIVTASRASGLEAPIDTVFTDLANDSELAASVSRARAAGFQGKLCLHPRQVPIVNDAFLPSASEIEKARRIEALMHQTGAGVATIDGKMIDRPVVDWARRTLAYARQAGRLN